MFLTEETSQSLRGWLKEEAKANMKDMSVTEETSQALRGWLKEEAPVEHAVHVGDRRDIPG